jgi:hypothetical protein
MAHIELDSAGYDLIDEATRIIRPPSHRALPFSDREQALIEDMTIETWTRLREMAGNR